MKIIALSCSPSKGRNSDSMLDAFIEGAIGVDKENIEIEKVYLYDIHINSYRFENGFDTTEDEENFKALSENIQKSTGLVIATPTYNFSVPAPLKNFIDRIRFFALDLNDKNVLSQPIGKLDYLKTYYLVSGGTPRWIQKIFFFAFPSFWLRTVFLYYGADCMGSFYSGNVETFKNEKILNICKKEGKKYAIKLLKGQRHGFLQRIFWRTPQVD